MSCNKEKLLKEFYRNLGDYTYLSVSKEDAWLIVKVFLCTLFQTVFDEDRLTISKWINLYKTKSRRGYDVVRARIPYTIQREFCSEYPLFFKLIGNGLHVNTVAIFDSVPDHLINEVDVCEDDGYDDEEEDFEYDNEDNLLV